jgi:hypothetical protein
VSRASCMVVALTSSGVLCPIGSTPPPLPDQPLGRLQARRITLDEGASLPDAVAKHSHQFPLRSSWLTRQRREPERLA